MGRWPTDSSARCQARAQFDPLGIVSFRVRNSSLSGPFRRREAILTDPVTQHRHEHRRLVGRRAVPRLGNVEVVELRANQLDAWYGELLAGGAVNGRPLSPNSVRHVHSVLHRALEQGIAWDWIAHNPARRATPPPARRPCIHLPSAGELAKRPEADRFLSPWFPCGAYSTGAAWPALIDEASVCTASLKTLGVSAVSPAIAATKDPSSCDSVIAARAFACGSSRLG
jgi:hypothetical protein